MFYLCKLVTWFLHKWNNVFKWVFIMKDFSWIFNMKKTQKHVSAALCFFYKNGTNLFEAQFVLFLFFLYWNYPANKYMLKFNNRNTRKKYETCSKLTIATPKQYYWHYSGVFIVIFEQTLYLGLVITLLILKRLLPARRFFQITFS